MAYNPNMFTALSLLKSSSETGGDCLGGIVSVERVRAYTPLVLSDEIDALEILAVGRNNTDSTTYPASRFRDLTITYNADATYTASCNGVDGDDVEVTTSVGIVSVEVETGIYVWAQFRVRRTPTIGSMTVRMCAPWNNALSMADATYGTSAPQYRCCFIYASQDLTITNITVSSGLTYAYNGDTSYTAPVADGYTSPGLVFGGSGAVSIALTAGSPKSIWFRTSVAGQGLQGVALWITYTVDGETYRQRYDALRRVPDVAIEGYVLYEGDDSESGPGTEVETSATLSFTYDITPPVSGTEEHRFRVARRNRYNIESDNIFLDASFLIDDGGADTTAPPDVAGLTATAEAQGYAALTWQYADQQGNSPAAIFSVTLTDGTTTITQTRTRGANTTDYYTTIGPLDWGVLATAAIKSVDAAGNMSAGVSAQVRLDAASDTAAFNSAAIQAATAQTQTWGNSATEQVGTLAMRTSQGLVSWGDFGYGEVLLYVMSDFLDTRFLYDFALVNADLTGNAGSDPVEVSGDKIYLCAGGKRVAEFDLTAVTLKAKYFSNVIAECPVDQAIYETSDRVYFQIADSANHQIRTWLAVASDGTLYLPIGVTQTT